MMHNQRRRFQSETEMELKRMQSLPEFHVFQRSTLLHFFVSLTFTMLTHEVEFFRFSRARETFSPQKVLTAWRGQRKKRISEKKNHLPRLTRKFSLIKALKSSFLVMKAFVVDSSNGNLMRESDTSKSIN
jgi:hypothetical protein